MRWISLVFSCVILAIVSTLAYQKATIAAIANIGNTKIRLYTIRQIYHRRLRSLLWELINHKMVKYGPDEHGSRNKLTSIQTANAHRGEETFSINDIILGLRLNGTSITNRFPYRKQSLRLASQTRSHNIPTTSLRTKVLLAVASAENNQMPIAKYVPNTAKAKSPHASKVFLLL